MEVTTVLMKNMVIDGKAKSLGIKSLIENFNSINELHRYLTWELPGYYYAYFKLNLSLGTAGRTVLYFLHS